MRTWRAFFRPISKIIFLLPAVIGLLVSPMVSAEYEGERVNMVKAAFVLNVARFVTWPTEAFDGDDDRLILCYYRSQPFAGSLDTIASKTVSGRQLEVVKVERLSEAKSCQILLISEPQLDAFAKEDHAGLTQPILTIADQTDAAPEAAEATSLPRGVLVSLVRDGPRISFEIDLSRSRSVGLQMSSQLLKHARIVGGGA